MVNLQYINESDIHNILSKYLLKMKAGSNEWRILSSALEISNSFSFTENRTYPRPDHPDEKKRKPIIYMLVAILVSLRTTLENEQKAVMNLIEKFPNEDSLYLASEVEIEKCIIPAGMAKVKSKRIRNVLDYVQTYFNRDLESLKDLDVTIAREKILNIPGVGPKSADCLLSIGLGKASIAVDVNVFRVTSWLFDLPWSNHPKYNIQDQVLEVKELLDKHIPKDAFLCQIIHTYFLLLGKNMRSKHPTNKRCLIHEYCLTCKRNERASIFS